MLHIVSCHILNVIIRNRLVSCHLITLTEICDARCYSKNLIRKLLTTYLEKGEVTIHTDSKDFDSWYNKRTAADGKIDFKDRTRNIYNLIRGVAAPFPGAFCYADTEDDAHKVTVWQAHPFDEMIDFSGFAPGEVVDIFDGKLVVRTVDGSLLIDKFEAGFEITKGMVLR